MVNISKKKNHIGGPKKIRHGSKFNKAGKVAAVMLTATLLASCANYSRDHVKVGSVPDDYRTKHPIVVSQTEKSADIIVNSDAKSLSHRDKQLVTSVGYGFKRSGAKTIGILVPTGSTNSRSAAYLAKESVRILRNLGVHRNQVSVQNYDASTYGASATLRLVYSDLTAEVTSECGKWRGDLMDTANNKNYGNFGCATQNNLASMIAHPADLLGPRGESEIDATRRTTVIDNWRENGAGTNKSYN